MASSSCPIVTISLTAYTTATFPGWTVSKPPASSSSTDITEYSTVAHSPSIPEQQHSVGFVCNIGTEAPTVVWSPSALQHKVLERTTLFHAVLDNWFNGPSCVLLLARSYDYAAWPPSIAMIVIIALPLANPQEQMTMLTEETLPVRTSTG